MIFFMLTTIRLKRTEVMTNEIDFQIKKIEWVETYSVRITDLVAEEAE